MKPVIIIAVSVVCSVVAVLGVLTGLEMYAVNESQKALAIELERQEVCNRLYDNSGNLKQIELWGICLNYGIDNSVQSDIESSCGTVEMCRVNRELLAINVVDSVIELDEDFRKKFTSQKTELEQIRSSLLEQIELQYTKTQDKKIHEQNWVMKYTDTQLDGWSSIYQECMNSEFDYYETKILHDNFCKKTLLYAVDNTFDYAGLIHQQLMANIMNDIPVWDDVGKNVGSNTESDKFSSYSKSCKANPHSDYLECMCVGEINAYQWYDLCWEW
ncbi:MAG: hypothetical protein ACW9W9_00500 [Candidatus Nitrosopumilus sp. Bin_571-38]